MSVVTNSSGRFSTALRRPMAPSKVLPSGSPPDASTGPPASLCVRHRPIASKFSVDKPDRIHQLMAARAHRRWRDAGPSARAWSGFSHPDSFSGSGGTFSGGGGTGVPSRFSRIHLPRRTGDVRFAYDVTVMMLPWPSSPPRT